MRDFALKPAETMSFTLGGGDKVYTMPLAASMPMELALRAADLNAMPNGPAKNLEAMRFERDLVARYVGEDAESLTMGQVHEIFMAWTEESSRSGAPLGE